MQYSLFWILHIPPCHRLKANHWPEERVFIALGFETLKLNYICCHAKPHTKEIFQNRMSTKQIWLSQVSSKWHLEKVRIRIHWIRGLTLFTLFIYCFIYAFYLLFIYTLFTVFIYAWGNNKHINSFNKCLLGTYYGPVTVVGPGDIAQWGEKADNISCSHEVYIILRR